MSGMIGSLQLPAWFARAPARDLSIILDTDECLADFLAVLLNKPDVSSRRKPIIKGIDQLASQPWSFCF